MAGFDDEIKEARKKLTQIMAEQVAAEEQALQKWIEDMKNATDNLSKLLQSEKAGDDYNKVERPLVTSAEKQISDAANKLADIQKSKVGVLEATLPKDANDKTYTFERKQDGSYTITGDPKIIDKGIKTFLEKEENKDYKVDAVMDGNKIKRWEISRKDGKPMAQGEFDRFMYKLYDHLKQPLKDNGYTAKQGKEFKKKYDSIKSGNSEEKVDAKKNNAQKTKSAAPTLKPTGMSK
jgi:hypothetical protein